jgi:hypothetical protein
MKSTCPKAPSIRPWSSARFGLAERVGAFVETEVRVANGRRRADFVAVGPEVTLAGEVQRSFETPQRISGRQRDLTRDGR